MSIGGILKLSMGVIRERILRHEAAEKSCWKIGSPKANIAAMKPFEEIVQFIADSAGAEKLGAFKPSRAAEERISELLTKQKQGLLSAKEHEELQLFVQLDHVMSLAKAKARSRTRSSAA